MSIFKVYIAKIDKIQKSVQVFISFDLCSFQISGSLIEGMFRIESVAQPLSVIAFHWRAPLLADRLSSPYNRCLCGRHAVGCWLSGWQGKAMLVGLSVQEEGSTSGRAGPRRGPFAGQEDRKGGV